MVAAMRSEIRAAWCRMFQTLLAGLLLIMGVATAGVVLPGLESQFFPVLREGASEIISRDDGALSFAITAEKLRPCAIDSVSWVLERDRNQDGVFEHNALTVFKDSGAAVVTGRDGAASYDIGPLVLGPFHTRIPANMKPGAFILATVEYQCHPFWTTRSVLARVPLS